MHDMTKMLIGAAALAATSLVVLSTAALAHDGDRYGDRYERSRWEQRRVHYVHERPVYIHESRPVIVERERPVFVAPQMFAPAQPSSLNFNFQIPLN
mgnify:FL=1